MTGNPYLITGPALISFSGGRSSRYMLKHILNAHGGTLPPDIKVVFANTGKEFEESLVFVRDVGSHYGVEITWLGQARIARAIVRKGSGRMSLAENHADVYARHAAQYAALEREVETLRATKIELKAKLTAREERIDEVIADRDKFLVERDHALARLAELETEFRSFGAMVCEAMRRRERPSSTKITLDDVAQGRVAAAEPSEGA